MVSEIEDIERLMAQGQTEQAVARLIETRSSVGFQLIERCGRDRHQLASLAKVFHQAHHYRMVALCFEEVGSYGRAGEMYAKSGDHLSAAEMYWRAGQVAEAAAAYEQGGELGRAAELYLRLEEPLKAGTAYEKAGNHYEAGRCLLEAGRGDRAIPLLQSVPEEHEHYLSATRMAAEALHLAQLSKLGLKRLEVALVDRDVDHETAPLFRQRALIQRDTGDRAGAEATLEALAAWNMGYEDVTQLLSELVQATGSATPMQASTPDDGEFMDARTRSGLDRLRDHSLLSECSLAELRLIYDSFERRLVEPETVLIEQDQPGTHLFILIRGRVAVHHDGSQLAELGPGTWFGEMSLVDEQLTSAQVRALDSCGLLSISLDDFRHVLDTNAEVSRKFYKQFARELSQRLRRAQGS